MKSLWTILAVLVMAVVALETVAMLPPETFKDPIFAAGDDSGDGGSSREHTEFA